MNSIKTVLLLGVMTGLIMLIGELVGGPRGMAFGLMFAAVLNFVSYWFSDRIVLMSYRAQQIEREQAPELYNVVQNLTSKANMPMPKLYLIPTDSPNAFATGRNPEHAAVAVTEGILKLLSRDELEGVLAHELSHVTNRDILISSIAATMAGAIMYAARIAQFGAMFGGFGYSRRDDRGGNNPIALLAMVILAPIASLLIQMAISRSREYAADESGARLVGHASGLARALEKIESVSKRVPLQANASSAHLFIMKPFSGGALMSLFSTHPPTEKRIERLKAEFGQF